MDVDVVVQPPPAAAVSALAVPDDPLDEGIMQQCLDAEKNGFFDFGAVEGAWFADFCDGSMDMSTRAGVDFLEMLLDGESSSAAEGAARAEADGRRPAVATMNVLSPSLSSSDDDHWKDSSSESEDAATDAHWLLSESSKNSGTGGGKKRRLPRQQQQQSAATGQRKLQQTEPAVVVEGGGSGNKGGYWCRQSAKVETPLWRTGAEGPKTLCNVCGLRHKNTLAPMAVPQTKTTTTKRLPMTTKPSGRGAKCKNRSVVSATVVRKKRSVAIRTD